jgi:hypothetical protein
MQNIKKIEYYKTNAETKEFAEDSDEEIES